MRIQPGTALFLYDCELKILYGVYSALSYGGANLVPAAFAGKYQAQVKFRIERNCHPLPESAFKHAIQENYTRKRFRPDLNYYQVSRLLSLFQNATAPPRQPPPLVDSQYAHQTVRHQTSIDSQYVTAVLLPPPMNNHYHSAPQPPPPVWPSTAHANYATQAPLPPSNDQYYSAPTYYQAKTLQASNGCQYYPTPPNYQALPLTAGPSQLCYPVPAGGSTQDYYPGNVVQA
ncbi:uncharacterized protein LOC109849074 [Asparagus officinalis]|uniref:uncharacterized protein LOC109849074 n=1 Tax=Asparagus officinalis TaxID=4686 RepID=UPI00098E3BE9|nr:uncharacterized protein LOC109849074 [Asparagus officinalis]